mmetsp:Transcript_19855/g.58997  ORF Transcript_19855/g.58997 Transcript_19855/m.58997 type:complete len:224 (-) Transcript_19855:73-744(-)
MRFSRRRRMASSMSHGKLVAASTMTRFGLLSSSLPSPSLLSDETWQPSTCTSSSVFVRREASCSPCVPRWLQSESTSSMNTMDGPCSRARSNRQRTRRSLSPRYFDPSVAEVTEKKVQFVSVATAFASMVLPVPGGPNSSTPLNGLRMPVKYSGMMSGSTAASSSTRFASCRPAMSVQRMLGDPSIMSRSSWLARSESGPTYSFFFGPAGFSSSAVPLRHGFS